MKKSYLAWLAVIVPIWLTLILCTHWEPVQRDGWGHFFMHRNANVSIYEFAKGTYFHNNPRLGQVLTYMVFTPGPYHVIFTPLAELLLFYLLTTMALGRWPSPHRTDDALLFATITAMTAITAPAFGPMLFYRPFTGNYLFGLVLDLVFLLPYRLAFEAPRALRWWWAPIVFVLGVAAGLCNEHTDPAFLALAAVATFAIWRRDRKLPAWTLAGIAGLIAGSAALFYAPGQAIRYNGLAAKASLLGRIADRGLAGNGRLVGALLLWLSPVLVWLILAAVSRLRAKPEALPRTRAWGLVALGAASLAITLTLMLSPKLGPRLYFGAIALACTAVAGWVIAQLGRVETWIAAVLATGVLGYAGYRCLSAYHEVGPEFAQRLDILSHAPANSVATIPAYTIKPSRWILGDDLLIEDLRNHVSFAFQLALIKVEGPQREATPPPAEDP